MDPSHEVLYVFLPVTCRIFVGVKNVWNKSCRKNVHHIYFSVNRDGFQGHLIKGSEHAGINTVNLCVHFLTCFLFASYML
jgi:hypothetical protein